MCEYMHYMHYAVCAIRATHQFLDPNGRDSWKGGPHSAWFFLNGEPDIPPPGWKVLET